MTHPFKPVGTLKIVLSAYLLSTALIILAGMYTSVQLSELSNLTFIPNDAETYTGEVSVSGSSDTAFNVPTAQNQSIDQALQAFKKLETSVSADTAKYDVDFNGKLTVEDLNQLLSAALFKKEAA